MKSIKKKGRFLRSGKVEANLRWNPKAPGELPVPGGEAPDRGKRFRVQGEFKLEWERKAAFRDRYGNIRIGSTDYTEIIKAERRADVCRHRGGLVNSLKAARQLITYGKVSLYSAEGNESKVRPGMYLFPGDRLVISPSSWGKISDGVTAQYKRWPAPKFTSSSLEFPVDLKGYSSYTPKASSPVDRPEARPIVPWLEVDWKTGALVFIYVPLVEEVYLPPGI